MPHNKCKQNKLRCIGIQDCGRLHKIKQVPFTITEPGLYCINRDLTYTGQGAAITVLANNVTIKNHATLTTVDPTSIGIFVNGPGTPTGRIENFNLIGGFYHYANTTTPTTQECNGIRSLNVDNANISLVTVIGYARGIDYRLCNGGSIRECFIRDVLGSQTTLIGNGAYSIRVDGSNGLIIDSCTVTGSNLNNNGNASFGVALSAGTGPTGIDTPPSDGIVVTNCNFVQLDLPIGVFGNNITFKNCNASLSLETGVAIAEIGFPGFGNPALAFPANNIQFIDCNFRAVTNPAFAPDGLLFFLGSNCLIQGCTLTGVTNPAGFDTAIHIGARNAFGIPDSVYNDVKIVNMVVDGPNEEVLFVDSGSNITVDNLVVSGVTVNGIHLLETRNVTIKNSDIQGAPGSGTGILVEPIASNVTIQNNNIRDFVGAGITAQGSVTVIRDNNIYSNGQGILINNPAANPVPVGNIEFNNTIPPIITATREVAKKKDLKVLSP